MVLIPIILLIAYNFPPKIGTTVTLFLGALWLVPISFLACLLLAIAAAAR